MLKINKIVATCVVTLFTTECITPVNAIELDTSKYQSWEASEWDAFARKYIEKPPEQYIGRDLSHMNVIIEEHEIEDLQFMCGGQDRVQRGQGIYYGCAIPVFNGTWCIVHIPTAASTSILVGELAEEHELAHCGPPDDRWEH